jgi:hypothetical protein
MNKQLYVKYNTKISTHMVLSMTTIYSTNNCLPNLDNFTTLVKPSFIVNDLFQLLKMKSFYPFLTIVFLKKLKTNP